MKTWITSDHHFGHVNILRFKKKCGAPLRDFAGYDEMEAFMIERWNMIIKPEDKVYHLGDFSMTKKHIEVAKYLNGRKTLIAGNHDIFNTSEYLKYFENVRAYRVLNLKNGGRGILSHIPIHEESRGRFAFNVHGHTHANRVMKKRMWPLAPVRDRFYVNACVEANGYYPLNWDVLDASYSTLAKDVKWKRKVRS